MPSPTVADLLISRREGAVIHRFTVTVYDVVSMYRLKRRDMRSHKDGLSGGKTARQFAVVCAFNFKGQYGVHVATKSDW